MRIQKTVRKSFPLPAALALLAALLAVPSTAQVASVEELEYPPLPSVELPQPQRMELDNGMVVLLIEDHELPLVEARAMIRTGSRREPPDHVGVAQLAGELLRSGGTEEMPSDQLDDYLEDRAARIETRIGTAAGRASMSCLAKDLPEILGVFADVLRRPAFEEGKLEVAKTQLTASIARQNDSPGQILSREFRELVYGQGSPYATFPTYDTVGNVDRDDLAAWHQRYFHPDRILLGLVGDFDSEEALRRIEEEFGDWPRGPEVDVPEAAYRRVANPGVFFVEKNDVTQSNIRIGHLGIRRDNPDYFAVELMNEVLGGGFAARLFSRVRSQKGLAYNVFGGVFSQWDYPGLFMMSMSTKTSTTVAGVEALIEEARNLTSEPPTDEEVERAREGILSSFVFRADSTEEILDQQLTYEYYGFPLDWLERYREGIETTTADQVRAAAEKYVHPEAFTMLVVGPSEGTDEPLEKLGSVTPVDVTIPEPGTGEEEVEVTEEDRRRGGELIALAVEGIGGAERLDALESYRTELDYRMQIPGGAGMQMRTTAIFVLPDRLRWEVNTPMGPMVQVVAPDAGFAVAPGQGVIPLPQSQREQLRATFRRIPMMLLRARDDQGFEAAAAGTGEVDGATVERVRVTVGDQVTTLGIDPETGRVSSLEYRGPNPMGVPGLHRTVFSDFREVDGLVVPHSTVSTFEGEPMAEGTTLSVTFDEPVDPSLFEPPEELEGS